MTPSWKDRARVTSSDTDIVVTPVSFVIGDSYQRLILDQLVAPEDEIIENVDDATKEWIFLLKKDDIVPVQIVVSIQATLDEAKDSFDSLMFVCAYRGVPMLEKRFFKRLGGTRVGEASPMQPIFNLKNLDISSS